MDNNFINDQSIDLIYTGWKWPHRDQHCLMENLIIPEHNWNDKMDAQGPFIVEAPNSHTLYSTPLVDALSAEYSPTKAAPALFKTFIHTENNAESYIQFANNYGLLKSTNRILFKDEQKKEFLVGESVLFWQRQQWMLKYTGLLWEWITTNNKEKLSLAIKWQDQWTINFQLGDSKDMSLAGTNKLEWTGYSYILSFVLVSAHLKCCLDNRYILTGKMLRHSNFPPGNVSLPAISLLQLIVNYYLDAYPTKSVIFYNTDKRQFQQHVIPTSLLSAMWHQFHQVITGERKIKQCPICLQWSDVTYVKGSWTKHRGCANWDRVTKSRKMPLIEKLLKQGISVNDISEEINIETRHIERWINVKILEEGEK